MKWHNETNPIEYRTETKSMLIMSRLESMIDYLFMKVNPFKELGIVLKRYIAIVISHQRDTIYDCFLDGRICRITSILSCGLYASYFSTQDCKKNPRRNL